MMAISQTSDIPRCHGQAEYTCLWIRLNRKVEVLQSKIVEQNSRPTSDDHGIRITGDVIKI